MNKIYNELSVTEAELENPEDEWQPIPLEPSDPNVKKAIDAVEETVKQVEQSNGYNAQYPEERKYVLDSLRMVSTTLKTAKSTSIAYLKSYALAPIAKLRSRFIEALIGETAKEAAKWIWNIIKEGIK